MPIGDERSADNQVLGTTPFNWEEKWRAGGIFDLMPDAIIAVSKDGRIARVNGQFTAMFGYARGELVGVPVEILLPERARRDHIRHRTGYQGNPRVRAMSKRSNLLGRRKDGSEFPVDIMLSPISYLADEQVIAVIRDVTAAKEAAEKLQQLAYTDQLTGLPNRAALHRDLGESLSAFGSSGTEAIAVALFDLDGFKDVNDTMGHSIGDDLLYLLTRRWTSTLPGTVRLYRPGGDEFVVLWPESGNLLGIVAIVQRMIEQLNLPFELGNHSIFIGTSVGIAIGHEAGTNIEAMLASADLALYRAKAEGGGKYALYVPVMRAEAQARRTLVAEIEQAFRAGELELHFQPLVRLADAKFSGAEALLRWRHPGHGVLPPSVFIKSLATSPIVSEVGRWVVRTACRQASEWRSNAAMPPLVVAVNLFHAQIRDGNLAQQIEEALAEFGLPPELLELEISENFALNGNEAVIRSLSTIRNSGVRLALDDLGTGHASLNYLTTLPVSSVKIDQSFVNNMITDKKNAVIVRTLIAMAHELDLKVIAEGVQTSGQADILSAVKCDHAQGYLFGRPLPAEDFEVLVADATPIRAVASGSRFRST